MSGSRKDYVSGLTLTKRTPEEMARREKIDEMLKAANVTSMADIQDLFKGKRIIYARQASDLLSDLRG